MSERGSYCTEFIYCPECAAAFNHATQPDEGGYHAAPVVVKTHNSSAKPVPRPCILAGFMGGTYPGQEIDEFRARVVPRLEKTLCHPLRIALLAEALKEIITVMPAGAPSA